MGLPRTKTSISNRIGTGTTLVETAASLALMLPVLITVLLAVLEVSQAYLIKQALAQASREAARDLAIIYASNQSIATSRSQQDSQVFNNIRINNIINASAQFANPTFNTSSNPQTVVVTVNYTSNQNGLPKFPNPDPLNLGSNFQLSATSTYRLE